MTHSETTAIDPTPKASLTEVDQVIRDAAADATDRQDLWAMIIQRCKFAVCAEIGVFRGEFAGNMLRQCPSIRSYTLVDPWRHLADWNKPANLVDEEFDRIRADAMKNTEFAAEKRIVLRGKTTEVSDSIPDAGLEFAYIDGDHTLRGISVDLVRMWPKLQKGGLLGGDDFCENVWQHPWNFEPTFVFPLAVYFAEGVGCPIYALPFHQFAIIVDPTGGFEFRDLTGRYRSTEVRQALTRSTLRRGLRKLLRVFTKDFT